MHAEASDPALLFDLTPDEGMVTTLHTVGIGVQLSDTKPALAAVHHSVTVVEQCPIIIINTILWSPPLVRLLLFLFLSLDYLLSPSFTLCPTRRHRGLTTELMLR